MVNADDMVRLGLRDGDRVDIVSVLDGPDRRGWATGSLSIRHHRGVWRRTTRRPTC